RRGLSMPSISSVSVDTRSSPGVKRSNRSLRRSNTPRKRLPIPSGHVIGAQSIDSTDSISSSSASGSRTSRSSLFTNVMIGVLRRRHTSSSLIVCASTPFAASITITAASTAVSTRYVSSEKSWWPGVSSRLIVCPAYSNCITELVTEMPRCFSTSIQSDVACRALLRDLTVPASWIAPPNSSSFSVSVVLPASGWEMIANVRRRATSRASASAIGLSLSMIGPRQGAGGKGQTKAAGAAGGTGDYTSAERTHADERAVQEQREHEGRHDADDDRDGVARDASGRINGARVAVAPPAGREHGDRPDEERAEQDHVAQRPVREQMAERPEADARGHRMPKPGAEMRLRHVSRHDEDERDDREQRGDVRSPRRRRP